MAGSSPREEPRDPADLIERWRSAIALGSTAALGLVSRKFPVGFLLWDKSLGDALYTVILYLLGALVRPSLAPRTLGLAALAASIVVETFQLTGIPGRLARGPGIGPKIMHLVLGATFSWHDIACYVLGAAAITAIDTWTRPRSSRR